MSAQSSSRPFLRIYVGNDGLAHVVDAAGKDVAMRREAGQTGVSFPHLSPDKRLAGWLVEQKNCCTSYNIPTRLEIYDGRKTQSIADGLMVYDWCFVSGATEVALSTGTVHGMISRHLTLYSTRTGKILRHWDGDINDSPPKWASSLKQ
jgi:hypothetical protein